MIIKNYRAGAAHEGLRLDSFLARISLGELTRSAAQRLITDGNVALGSRAVKKNYIVAEGDDFIVTMPEPAPTDTEAEDIPLDIVFEDSDIIVLNKARGMVVHPAPGHAGGTLVNALLHHCRGSLSGIGGELRPGIVHRIDKDTSGLIIAAKNDQAHLALSDQLRDHSLARVYEAIVCGSIKQDAGTVRAPIGRHRSDRKKMGIISTGREAVTHYEVLVRYRGYTHVLCRLETGRTHQIRVHMAHIGHPLLGDMVYGRRKPELGLSTQCLHARRLQFIHPRTGEHMKLEIALPQYFMDILAKLEKR